MELSSLQSLLHLSLFLVLPLFVLLLYYKNPIKKQITYGLKAFPLLGGLFQFLENRHRFLDWNTEVLAEKPTHTITFKSPIQVNRIITANPLNVEHILKTNFSNYPTGSRTINMLQDFLGHGIFNSDGDDWKQQRKTASYEFNKRSLRDFVVSTVHHEIEQRLIPFLVKAGENNEILDLQDVLERFAFDNICKIAFNEDPACLSEQRMDSSENFMKAFGEAQNLTVDRFMDAVAITWRIKKLLNIGSERRLKQSVLIVHDYAMKIIQSRKAEAIDQNHDLLSRFASNRDNTDELLRDVVISFITAGRETTSSALTWFFWLLSSRPDVEKKILKEVRSIRKLRQISIKSSNFSFDELREMNYLHAAISESMRLYPPVALDTVSCAEDDIMPDGTFVGKGWFVTYNAYAMGRMEDIWGKDCIEYKPERWLNDGIFRPESPFRYPIFHAGPRMCLGKEMAYIQMKSIIANVLVKFEINVVEKEKTPGQLLSLTLRMKGGLQITVTERNREQM